MRIPRLVVVLVFLMLSNFDALGQAHPAWMERGQAAFAEARYDDAQEAFQWIIDRESDNGEVRYLMAKVLMAKGEVKAADRSIVRALRIEPDNTRYLELQLEIGFPREPMEILRRTRKDDLAAKILAMDSLSVPANIQLGQRFVYEWLEWRGRITVDDMAALPTPGRPNFTGNLGAENANPNRPVAGGRTEIPSDLFDLKNQEALGKDVIDLSPRATAAYPKAVAYLKKALLREPENEKAILHLARLYTTWPNLVALSSLGKSLQKNTPDSRYGWLLRGYAQHYLGNERIAEEEFSRALTFMPDSIRTVFSDTDRLLNKEELKQKKRNSDFDDDAFWDYRDPRFLTPENERLAEHYARVFFAELHYSEPKLDLEGWDSERGEVYIRYGKPDVEYYMSNAVAQCGAATYDQFHIFEYANFRFVFGNLWPQLNQYVFYSPCSRVYESFAAMGAQIDYVIDAKDNIDENPEIYKHEATRKRVEFPYLASRFKGENGEVDVYVPYGIPVQANALELEQTLSLHAGAFLLSEEEGLLKESHRRMSKIKSKEITLFKESSLWLDALQLSTPPGTYGLSVEFETETGAGEGFHRVDLEVPAFDDTQLQLSDLMLAYVVEESGDVEEAPPGTLLRDGLLIKPAPWGVFSKEQPMYLYFEMYNLKKNAENRSEYAVESALVEYRGEKGLGKLLKRAFKGRAKEGVSVRFNNTGESSDEGQYLILEAEDQPIGTYVLAMRVTDLVSKKTVEIKRLVLLE